MADVEALRQRWTHLYRIHLPALAKTRDPVQSTWPVHLDHCFARIILDNAIGIDRPWTEVVKAPAVKNMSAKQLESAVDVGERVATGQDNLVDLDERSLELRGKAGKTKKRKAEQEVSSVVAKRVKEEEGTISKYFVPSPSPSKQGKNTSGKVREDGDNAQVNDATVEPLSKGEDISIHLKRIADSDITPFRKKMLTMLCQIPRGRYSTYQAMSDHITRTSHKTCARAVGNAMRNNPFAPEVPCHRVVAHNGQIGGFNGSWGEQGMYAKEKHKLLHDEGVRFDSRGKVKGPPFRNFYD